MTANGFLEQKQNSPLGLGTVVLLHGAAIAAVLMLKGPGFIVDRDVDTKTFDVRPVEPPPPIPEPVPMPQTPVVQQRSVVETPDRIVITPPTGPTQFAESNTAPPGPTVGTSPDPTPTREIVTVPPRDPPRDPVRVSSLFDPRFEGSRQPPYPPSEERAEREGQVRIRVTIGPDGRVSAAQRVSATNDAFWRVTERQALTRWRFRPATVDGRPVAESKTLTVIFRLDGR